MAKAFAKRLFKIPPITLDLEPAEVEALVGLLGLCVTHRKTEPMELVNEVYKALIETLANENLTTGDRKKTVLLSDKAGLRFDWQ